jgi:hypothetical protein
MKFFHEMINILLPLEDHALEKGDVYALHKIRKGIKIIEQAMREEHQRMSAALMEDESTGDVHGH